MIFGGRTPDGFATLAWSMLLGTPNANIGSPEMNPGG
jgi:hypothetical protein